jgi:hypothetical protein
MIATKTRPFLGQNICLLSPQVTGALVEVFFDVSAIARQSDGGRRGNFGLWISTFRRFDFQLEELLRFCIRRNPVGDGFEAVPVNS